MPVNRLSLVEAAREAARLGGQRARQLLHGAEARVKDESYNLVTTADLATEKYIREILSARFPQHTILGEEGRQNIDLLSPSLWIVDPIDGTNNYVHGVPHYATSVAFAEGGEVVAGAVHDPERGELFSAYLGGGAYLNNEPISVSSAKSLTSALICTGFYYDRGEMMERTLASIRRLFNEQIHGIRRSGSAALDLCWTAAGRFDGFFEYEVGPWDYAAGALILTEAGGVVSGADGSPLTLATRHIAAATPGIQASLLRAISA
ncbi:MAG: inositol monophosphatase family protein [Spirochaetaceae bacterium]